MRCDLSLSAVTADSQRQTDEQVLQIGLHFQLLRQGPMKHLGDSALQVATDGLVVAVVGTALVQLYLT